MFISRELLIWIRFKIFYKFVKFYSNYFIHQKTFKINNFFFYTVKENNSMSKFLLKFNLWEKKERSLIQFLDEGLDTVEAGGGIGSMSVFLRDKIGPKPKIFVLEPNPKLCEIILNNFKLNNLDNLKKNIIINKALSNKANLKVQLYEFDEPFENKLTLDSYEFTNRKNSNLIVETIDINSIIKEYNINQFQLIIDVEGEEYNILNYNNDWLSKCKYIMFEAHHESTKMIKIYNILQKNNFLLYKKNYNVYLYKRFDS